MNAYLAHLSIFSRSHCKKEWINIEFFHCLSLLPSYSKFEDDEKVEVMRVAYLYFIPLTKGVVVKTYVTMQEGNDKLLPLLRECIQIVSSVKSVHNSLSKTIATEDDWKEWINEL